MDGLVAPLDKICDLADKYDALVMVDECHAAVWCATGKGTKGVMGELILYRNFRKALGGGGRIYCQKKKL
jgi:glycine C-acetyltransferase